MTETVNNSKMLDATEHNWELIGPGDWNSVTWTINYDMSYTITVRINPEWDPDSNELPQLVVNTVKGVMDRKSFEELKDLLEVKQWRNPDIQIKALDGVAWQIEYYSVDGKIKNSSGGLGYIYGEEILESIVNKLPIIDKRYEASAFISVSRKQN